MGDSTARGKEEEGHEEAAAERAAPVAARQVSGRVNDEEGDGAEQEEEEDEAGDSAAPRPGACPTPSPRARPRARARARARASSAEAVRGGRRASGVARERARVAAEVAEVPAMRSQIDELTRQIRDLGLEPKRHEHHRARELRRRRDDLVRHVADLEGGVVGRGLERRVRPFVAALTRASAEPEPAAPAASAPPKLALRRGRRARRRTPKDTRPVRVKSTSRSDRGRTRVELIKDEFEQSFGVRAPPIYVVSGDDCPHCGGQMRRLAEESMMCCAGCGRSTTYVDTTALSLGYGEDADFAAFSYRRDNHFREWLQCFQGKESTEIPRKVMADIAADLAAARVAPGAIDQKRVRATLKKLKLRKYYENTTLITCRLTGRRPPRLSAPEEEQLRRMFQAIQAPFEKHCPPDRKNFLSYSYCLYKFCELLRLDKYLKHFSLLKGRDKLFKQDQIFRKICSELNWQYIPSV